MDDIKTSEDRRGLDRFQNFHENVVEEIPPMPGRVLPIAAPPKIRDRNNVVSHQRRKTIKRRRKNKMARFSRRKNRK